MIELAAIEDNRLLIDGLRVWATTAARSLGISPQTARTYLKRVKAKYHRAGIPVYTKLDLAQQVRADCTAGTCHLSQGRAESAGGLS